MVLPEKGEKHGTSHGESPVDAIILFFADYPYSTLRVRDAKHSSYDNFTADDMKDFLLL